MDINCEGCAQEMIAEKVCKFAGARSRTLYSIAAIVLFGLLQQHSAVAATVNVNSDATLRTAISTATPGDTVIFTSDITLASSLPAITVNLTIDGGNFALDGAALYSAFFVRLGNVAIKNLTVRNTTARGGNGGGGADGGGGGGLGAGGGLFVYTGATVTIQDVAFTTNVAQGGNGNTAGANSGGAGGGGLNGGNAGTPPSGSGTGGPGSAGASSPFFPGSGGIAGTGGGVNTNNGGAGGAATFGGGGGGGGAATGAHSGGPGGTGGFGGGGGGGGIGTGSGAAGIGGFGAGNGGNGNNGPGQAGTGFGGAVFVLDGGLLIVKASAAITFSGNSALKGTTPSSSPKQNLGDDIYINGTTFPLTFQIDAGVVTLNSTASAALIGAIAGDGKLSKTGAGTLVLPGNRYIYTGGTSVDAGTLLVTGATPAGSTVAVNTGGTLGGTGTIAGTTQIANGATLSPGLSGVSIGTLTMGTVIFNASSNYSVDLDGTLPSSDKIVSSGTVNCAGTLTVASAANSALGKVYTIVTGVNVTGTFSGLPTGTIISAQNRSFQIAYTSTRVTLTDVLNSPPVIDSFSATPTAITAGDTVTFTVSASDPNGTTPTITFDYGDGTTGIELTHVYASAGTFTATVSASDEINTTTKQVTITVKSKTPPDFNSDGFVGPMDLDTDGDGVPDEMEIALGTSPTNPSDSPTKGAPPTRFRIEGQKVKFSNGKDVILIKGILHVDAGFDPTGKVLVVDVGGNVRKLTLDDHARAIGDGVRFQLYAKRNPIKAREARFSLNLSGTLLSNLLLNAPKDAQGQPTQVSTHVLFNGVLLVQTAQLSHRK